MTTNRFMGSREFNVALAASVVAAVIAFAVAAAAPAQIGAERCAVPEATGTPEPADGRTMPAERSGADAVARKTYAWDLDDDEELRIDACAAVGSIDIAPSRDGTLHVTATLSLHGGAPEDVDPGIIDVRAARHDDGLHLAIDHGSLPERLGFFHSTEGHVHLVIRIPSQHGALSLELGAGAGDVRVTGLDVDDLVVHAGVGEVALRSVVAGNADLSVSVGELRGDLTALGNLSAHTSVGDIDLRVTPGGNASWDFGANVGDVRIEVPRTSGVGYDVRAATNVGDATVSIGPTERDHRVASAPGDIATATSEGYDDARVRIEAYLQVSVGDAAFVVD